jgi:RNA polymerase sigma factor (sigma-70 family)
MVLGVCRRLLVDPNDAEDAFQATFLVLVRKAGSVRNGDSLAHWLHGVARRIAFHYRAAAARRRKVEQEAGTRVASTYYEAPALWDVWDAVERLPQNLQSAIVLCYLEGLTHEQAAARLNWPVGTIRSRLARARAQLRTRLERSGIAPDVELIPMLAFKAISVPERLVEPLTKAAMLVAARDAAEAGLVSASVASLAEGALFAMRISRLKSAIAVLLTASALVCGAAYAYQDNVSRSDAPKGAAEYRRRDYFYDPAKYETKQAPPTHFPERIIELVKRVNERERQGEFQEALGIMTEIQVVWGHWQSELLDGLNGRVQGWYRERQLEYGKAAANKARDVWESGPNATSASDRRATDRRLDELENAVKAIMRVLEADRQRADGSAAPKTK